MERNTSAWTKLALLLVATALPAGSIACGSASEPDAASDNAALKVIGTGPNPTGTIIIGPMWPPPPVYAAKVLEGTVDDAVDTASLSWNEPGGNGTTILYRQSYDLAGNPSGAEQEVARWSNLGASKMTYDDVNHPIVVHGPFNQVGLAAKTSFVGNIGSVGLGSSPIQPDHQIGYEVVEIASGFSDCHDEPGGSTCARTSTLVNAPKAIPYRVGRAQLRLKVAQATSNVGSLHVLAQLNAWNLTWLDSTQNDFVAGSNVTYDLKTTSVDKLSDIQSISVWTPDADGICVSEVQLKLDNATAYEQSFPSCQWVKNGSTLEVPFGALRSNPAWRAYAPPQLIEGKTPPLTYVGFDHAGLVSYLDTAVGTQLKNSIPTAADGNDAQLGDATSATRADATHLHVQQHLRNLHVEWDTIDLGNVDANPTYDLVIHQGSEGKCKTGQTWCVTVENVDAGASYSSGILEWLLGTFTDGLSDLVEHFVNDKLESALERTKTGLPDADGSTYCFAPAPGAAEAHIPRFLAGWWDDGVLTPWSEGSLTVCR